MANLIYAIDLCYDLYVAKIAEGRSGIIQARVERVSCCSVDKRVCTLSSVFADFWLLRVYFVLDLSNPKFTWLFNFQCEYFSSISSNRSGRISSDPSLHRA